MELKTQLAQNFDLVGMDPTTDPIERKCIERDWKISENSITIESYLCKTLEFKAGFTEIYVYLQVYIEKNEAWLQQTSDEITGNFIKHEFK